MIAAVLALHTGALSLGILQFADADCADADHAALSNEHAALSHEHRGEHVGTGHAEESPIAESSHGDDQCPPFCGDCHDCAGCFHPVAVVTAHVSAPLRPVIDPRTTHPDLVPHAPPAWDPPAPLHVPIHA